MRNKIKDEYILSSDIVLVQNIVLSY